MIYLVLFILSFLLTLFIKNYAIKKSFVATVNERSSHTIPTPHGGGIAIAITWFIGLIYLFVNGQIDNTLFYALMVGVIISSISFLDDIFELSAKFRLIVQALVAISGLVVLGGLNNITFGLFIIENQILTNIFAFFLIVWFINLYNFLDGIDGYAGSEAIFLSFAGLILFAESHFLVLIVAVLGFLFWNWYKAKIFMGDVGSTLLGYNIAIFTIYYANHEAVNLWIWIVLFGLFWFDATLTLLRRKLNGEKLSQAHKKHAYQRLTQAEWSHDLVVKYGMVINGILLFFVYILENIFIVSSLSMVILYLAVKFVDNKKPFI